MKEDILKSPLTLKVAGLLLLAIACFYLGKHWASDYDQVQIVISSISSLVQSHMVALAPTEAPTYDLSSLNITKPTLSSSSITTITSFLWHSGQGWSNARSFLGGGG